ncbi:MAG: hypothetical protein QXT38_00025 [Candidatus Aenigmatarchaeota archaeon]
MEIKGLRLLLTFLFVFCHLVFLNIVRSDMLVLDFFYIIKDPGSFPLVFLINFLTNFCFLLIILVIFVNKNVKEIINKRFVIAVFLLTIINQIGEIFLLDLSYELESVLFNLPNSFLKYRMRYLICCWLSIPLILFTTFLVCKKILNIPKRQSILIGVFMSIFTNPIIYLSLGKIIVP